MPTASRRKEKTLYSWKTFFSLHCTSCTLKLIKLRTTSLHLGSATGSLVLWGFCWYKRSGRCKWSVNVAVIGWRRNHAMNLYRLVNLAGMTVGWCFRSVCLPQWRPLVTFCKGDGAAAPVDGGRDSHAPTCPCNTPENKYWEEVIYKQLEVWCLAQTSRRNTTQQKFDLLFTSDKDAMMYWVSVWI